MKLINKSSLYNCSVNKDLNRLIFQLKYLSNILTQKGYYNFEQCEIIPVRYSIKKNSWVVDYCSKKEKNEFAEDLSVNHLELDSKLNNDNFIEFVKNINILNNEFKFLLFVKKENDISFLGIFNLIKSKYRDGINIDKKDYCLELIDNSETFVSRVSTLLNLEPFLTKKLSFKFEWKEFEEKLNSNDLVLKIGGSEKSFKITDVNLINNFSSIKYEECVKVLNGKNIKYSFFKKNKFKLFSVYILNLFLIILNNKSNSNIKNILIFDNLSNKFYNIRKIDFLDDNSNIETIDYNLLLPLRI